VAGAPDVPMWMLYPLFFVAVYLSHLTLLRLPYFWDEAGYYIPAAWDFFRTGRLVPISTASTGHPPLPSILLAGWWRLSGFVPSGTRTLVCMVAAGALLAVYRLARGQLGWSAAIAVTLLTAIYPIWFAQSTLAHADIFAACFTLWGLAFYFEAIGQRGADLVRWTYVAAMFSLAALSKETAVITPVALALWEACELLRDRSEARALRGHVVRGIALLAPTLPLTAWYGYNYHRTGFAFGTPGFLRYNATANLDAHRIALALYHRLLHLTMHMNMFVPVTCAVAALLMPAIAGRARLPRPVLGAIAVVLGANWIAFSVLGGALLTRYLLPMYPLVLLLCVAEWQRHLRAWYWLAVLSAAAFLAGIWINPPYAFAPEDNLTYRDMVVLHQRAIGIIAQRWPQATVLTAWPASSELERPELGYTKHVIRAVTLPDFSVAQIERAAQDPRAYDTALIFSTKWTPPPGAIDLSGLSRRGSAGSGSAARYFDFHEDVRPAEAAAILHGELVWQANLGGEWVAILRFPRIEDATLGPSIIVPLW